MYEDILTFEPRHEISNNVVSATSKASDHPAHMHSLIRAFASRLNILGHCFQNPSESSVMNIL